MQAPTTPTRTHTEPSMSQKAMIEKYDMSLDMQGDALNAAARALDRFSLEKDIACYIKQEFDARYSPNWHCIVGKSFGSCIMYESDGFIYFFLGGYAFMLYKCTR